MAVVIQMRRDTSTNWTSNNPLLAEGEIGYETNTGSIKIGNGSSLWNDLTYVNRSSDSKKVVILKPIAETDFLQVADGIMFFVVPVELNNFNLISVGAHVFTPSTSGLPEFGIYNLTQSLNMLTTNITIDENEKDSKDATTPAVINTSNNTVSTGDEIRIDIKAIGTGTKGAEIRLGFE